MRTTGQRNFLKIARSGAAASLFIALLLLAPLSGDSKPPQDNAPTPAPNVPAPKPNVEQPAPDPWTPAQTVEPAALAKEISDSSAATKPKIACVGFRVLYEGGHIPGASYHGPTRTDEGLADLKKWADPLPRSTNVVLYCGCCPLTHCPNLRPAFAALRDMGFTHVRAAIMPTNFATDWAAKGYPIEKGN